MNYFLWYIEPITDWPAWIVASLFFGPLCTGAFIYFYFTRYARLWRKGIFPPQLKPTESNLLEAYLALASRLMLLDKSTIKGKTQFINDYFNRYFQIANYNFGDSLVFSLNHPIQTETVTDWINKHWKEDRNRIQLIYFLVGISIQTERITSREFEFIGKINVQLGFKTDKLEEIIAIYQSYFEEKAHRQNKSKTKTSLKKSYLKLFGLKDNYSQIELKKSYRRLAKTHHPDNYASDSISQQNIAKEKFIQIQNAYAYLTKKGNSN